MRSVSCRRAITLATALSIVVALPRPLAAQTGSIQGQVTDTSETGIVGATVMVSRSSIRATTSARGGYVLTGVPAGRQVLRVRSFGFTPESLVVEVTAGAIAKADVRLRASTAQLAAVHVVVGSRARHTAAEELAVPVDVYTP